MRLFTILLVLTSNIYAQSASDLFNLALKSYEAKEYTLSLELFKEIEALPLYSSDVYYNMANCYYKTHQKSKAILYYEKALKLAPNDEDVLFNLKLVELQLVDKIAQIPQPFYFKWIVKAKNLLSLDGWTKTGLFFVFLFSIFLIFFFTSNDYKVKKRLFLGLSLCFIFGAKSLSMAYYCSTTEETRAVLMQPNAYIKSAPSLQSEDLFILHEGTKVLVLEEFNDWTKIKLSDGMIGWLETQVIEII